MIMKLKPVGRKCSPILMFAQPLSCLYFNVFFPRAFPQLRLRFHFWLFVTPHINPMSPHVPSCLLKSPHVPCPTSLHANVTMGLRRGTGMSVGCLESWDKLMAMHSGVMVSSAHVCDSGVGLVPHKWGSLPPEWGWCPTHVGKSYRECFLEMTCPFSKSTATSAILRRAAAATGHCSTSAISDSRSAGAV